MPLGHEASEAFSLLPALVIVERSNTGFNDLNDRLINKCELLKL
jgi:hypothetical protein